MSEKTKETVSSVTMKILIKLSNQLNTSSGKATLASLRHSIGRPINESKEVWPILFESLPEEFLGQDGDDSLEEVAILTAIQLYSLQQQGTSQNVFTKEADRNQNIGYSLKNLRKGDDTTAVDRRFNIMITSSTFEELIYHLRHLLTLLKTKSSETKINYARLAEDLYWFLKDYQESVRLNWARQYYKQDNKGEQQNEN
jgi:CRISPR system Cascade subunit CasB